MSQKKAILFITVVGILILSFFIVPGHIPHEQFNSRKWITADLNTEANMSLRWDMMNSLRNNYELTGMSRNELEQLLGQPDDTTKSTLSYYLGYTGTGINTGTLYITFNKNNKVSSFRVWQG